ncbi:MAG: hypothetical protein N3G80_03740 [Candidatus Micrarchaeota archaeon]|nr:hypothetical protein [Candidatus Micrarchaeota archaeon]
MLTQKERNCNIESGRQNKSLLFFRQLKTDIHPDKKLSKKLSIQTRDCALSFLKALFAEQNTKKAKQEASRLISLCNQKTYELAVNMVEESLSKYGGKISPSRFLPDIALVKAIRQKEQKLEIKSSKMLLKFEKIVEYAIKLGPFQTSLTLEWLEKFSEKFPQAVDYAKAHALYLLQQKFASSLYHASNAKEITNSCWYARRAISLSKSKSDTVNKISLICEEFCNSWHVRKIGLEPDEVRKIFSSEIPDLMFFSEIHLFFDNCREKIGRALIEHRIQEAQELALKAMSKAEELASKALIAEFKMLYLEASLFEALFVKNSLKEAIEHAKQVVSLSKKQNAPLPTFTSELFFRYAYQTSKQGELLNNPCVIRRTILREVPGIQSNYTAEIERLELQLKNEARSILSLATDKMQDDLFFIAYRIAELSFFAPSKTFLQKRKTIVEILESFAQEYEMKYGKQSADRVGYSLEKIRGRLSRLLPDLYQKPSII